MLWIFFDTRFVQGYSACIIALQFCCGSIEKKVPIVAATDYVRAYPQTIASYVRAPFTALGTDGFGRSDTRAALRGFFEVNREHIVVAALAAVSRERAAEAIERYGIDAEAAPSWLR